MKKMGCSLVLIIVLSSLTACTGGRSLWRSEKEMNSVGHWNVLANQVANRINHELVRKKMFTTTVHVRHSCGTASKCGPSQTYPFDEGFHDLLMGQLVNFGVQAVDSPDVANMVMEYKVQTVFHPPKQSTWNWFEDDGYFEILVSVYVVEKNKYFFLFTDIYTIPRNEFWQYHQFFKASEIKLTGLPIGVSPQANTSAAQK